MTRHVGRFLGGLSLALLGLAIVLVELARYWRFDHAIHPTPVIIGGVIALFGAYILDPKGTRGGGDWIVGVAERTADIVAIWRKGRRADDVVGITSAGEIVPMPPAVQRSAVPEIELPPPSAPNKGGE
jgi:hypothetical protein